MKTLFAILLVCIAVTFAQDATEVAKRDLVDTLMNGLGVGQIVDGLKEVKGKLVQQFLALCGQLMFAGKQMIEQAKPILAQMVQDLKDHHKSGAAIVAAAIDNLHKVLLNNIQKPQISNEKRDIMDTIMNGLGLNQIIDALKQMGGNLFSQLMMMCGQLLFAGKQVIEQAKPIINQMIQDLKDHTKNGASIVSQTIAALHQVIVNNGKEIVAINYPKDEKRDLVDTILNGLGVSQIIDALKQVKGNLVQQFLALCGQLMFAGKQVIEQAKPILAQMVQDLKDHHKGGASIVSGAIDKLQALIVNAANNLGKNPEKRDVMDTIMNGLGLNQIIEALKQMGGNLFSQLMIMCGQLLFAGKQVIEQAKPIINQMIQDLKDHTKNGASIVSQTIAALHQILANAGKDFTPNVYAIEKRDLADTIMNGLGLSQIADSFKEMGNNLFAQLMAMCGQLLFAGKQVIEQAKPILNQMVQDLKDHTKNGAGIISQTIAALHQILANAGKDFAPKGYAFDNEKRDLIDTVMNTLGLGQIANLIKEFGGNAVAQFMALCTQVMIAGKQIIEKAKPIVAQMFQDLKEHSKSGAVIIASAIKQLHQLLASVGKDIPTDNLPNERRDLVDTIMNDFGFGQIVDSFKEMGANLFAQLMAMCGQLLFAGKKVIEQAKPILAQMVQDLKDHTSNGANIVSQTIAALHQVILNNAKPNNN